MANFFAEKRKNSQNELKENLLTFSHILMNDPVIVEHFEHLKAVNSHIFSKYKNELFITVFKGLKVIMYKKIEDLTTRG